MKRILSLLCVIAMLITMLPAATLAGGGKSLSPTYKLILDWAHGTYDGTPQELSSTKYAVVDYNWVKGYDEEIDDVSYIYFSYMGQEDKESCSLVEGRDYTISYANNIEVGTAQIIATGIGDYSGTLTATFEISKPYKKFDYITNSDRSISIETGKPGSEIKSITADGAGYPDYVLKEGTDYLVSDDGVVTLTTDFLDCKGSMKPYDPNGSLNIDAVSYSGSVSFRFYNLRCFGYVNVGDKVYSGKQQSIKMSLNSCKEGRDYKIVYDKKTRVAVGKYYFTVENMTCAFL